MQMPKLLASVWGISRDPLGSELLHLLQILFSLVTLQLLLVCNPAPHASIQELLASNLPQKLLASKDPSWDTFRKTYSVEPL